MNAWVIDPKWPLGMKVNNPGNLKYSPDVKWEGSLGPSTDLDPNHTDQGDPQVVFSSPELGLRAMAKLMKNKYDKGMVTPMQLIAGEGGWTPGYSAAAENVAASLGINPNDDMNLKDRETFKKAMRALITQEHGQAGAAYTDEMIDKGIDLASVSVPYATNSVRQAEAPNDVAFNRDAEKNYDYYKQTGIDGTPNAARAGRPQINVYEHVNWTRVHPQVKQQLEVASARLGIPFNITSGYRDLSHPSEAKKKPGSLHRHTTGKAIDLDVGGYSDGQKAQIVETLVSMGATGVGVYPGGKMIHVDWTGLGTSYKGPGTASRWYGGLRKAPEWFDTAMSRGLENQKKGTLPSFIDLPIKGNDGSYASMPKGQQTPDISYKPVQLPDFDTEEEAYVRGQNDLSISGMSIDGVSYADQWKTAFNRSQFIPNLNAALNSMNFQYDPNYDIEKDLPRLTEGIPQQYWSQFEMAGSGPQAEFIREQVLLQMKQDAVISANPKMGFLATVVAEILDPVTAVAAIAGERALTPYLAALKVARVGRAGKAVVTGLAVGGGNLAAEATLDAVDPRQRSVSDYAMALGAGFVVGGALGYFTRGNTAVDNAINEELGNLGRIMTREAEQVRAREGSVGAAARPDTTTPENVLDPEQWDFETNADVGRKASTALRTGISDPITKAEKIGPEAFDVARSIIPDPRGARGGETVEETVIDRFNSTLRAQMYDWETTAFPQYEKWAKRNLTGWSRTKNRLRIDDTEVNTFFKLVNRYVEETDPLKKAAFDPEVKAVGDKFAKVMNTMREEAVANGIKGMPDEARPNYSPLYRDDESIRSIQEKFSHRDLELMVQTAFKRKLTDASDDLIRTLSEGYLRNLTRASLSMEDPFQRVFAKSNRDQLIAFMKEELGIKDVKLIDEFMGLPIIRQLQDGGAATPRVKSRAFDLEDYNMKVFLEYRDGYTGPRKGKGEEVSLRDFFERNTHVQMSRYLRDMSGVIAFSKMKVYNRRTQELMIDGVRDDADWAKVKELVAASANARDPRNAGKVKDLLDELDYVYNEVRKNGGDNPRMNKIGRRMMIYSFIHFMQNMGINQAQEFVNIVSGMGIRAAIKGIPAYRRMLTQAGQSVPIDPVMRDLQVLMGRGDNVLIGSRRHLVTEAQMGQEMASGRLGRGFDTVLAKGQAVVSKISGMEYIDNYLQNWAMRAAAQYFADLAAKYGKKIDTGTFKMDDINTIFTRADAKRLRGLGLDDKKLVRVLNSFRKHSGVKDSKTRLRELNLDKWDPEDIAVFRTALDRWSSRAIQQNEIGTLSRYLSHPIAKLMLQFRTFVFGAYNKQTMYGFNHLDMRTVSTWMLQLMAGAGTWYLFQKTMSLGEENPDKYMRDKFGEPGSWDFYRNLGTAGLNRSGFTSVFPMIYDTGAGIAGLPRLDGRASGQASAAWGSPVVSLFDQTSKAVQQGADSWMNDRDQSRQEIKNNVRTVFGNWLPLMALTGALTQDRPERPPRNN
jgi:uncharacterized protein YcbK (DUF882 family)